MSDLDNVWRSALAAGALGTAAAVGLFQDAMGVDRYQTFIREHWTGGWLGWLADAGFAALAMLCVWRCASSAVNVNRSLSASAAAERIVDRALREGRITARTEEERGK